MRLVLLAILCLPLLSSAAPADSLVAGLLAEAWPGNDVRVEWSFNGPVPAQFAQHPDWRLADPRPTRLSGSMILTLERTDEHGRPMRLAISGRARVFGPVLVPARSIGAGTPVTAGDFRAAEAEWTNLPATALTAADLAMNMVAARALVPGRPATSRDVKPAPVIRQGQAVDLELTQGSVHIRLRGRALENGATGDVIAVAVELERSKRLRGRVAADGHLTLAQ